MELRLFLVAALFVASAFAEPLREDFKQFDVAEAGLNPDSNVAETPVEKADNKLMDKKVEEEQDAKVEELPDAKVEELLDAKLEELPDAKVKETPNANVEEVPKSDTKAEDVAKSDANTKMVDVPKSDSDAKKKNVHKSFKTVSADPHSSLAKTVIFCEGARGMLRCPAGTKIVITAANYGRTAGRFVCPHRSIRTTSCRARSSLQKVRKSCQKHASCALHASNSAFGDPCRGTYKYLQVSFRCRKFSVPQVVRAHRVGRIVHDYRLVGCFVDRGRRAIPHSGKNFHYGSAAERINLCASLAAMRGYDTFGVQYGGQCFTGPMARQTYRRYGKGGGCRSGLGGTWRNNVYFLGKTYKNVGCFRDTGKRAIPYSGKTFGGTPQERINLCASLATCRGFAAFAVQAGGQCFTGPNAHNSYNQYSHGGGCRNGLGGSWRNDVYWFVPSYRHVGCFKDAGRRAIAYSGKTFHHGTSAERINQCALLAAKKGYDTFGVQYNGQCFTSASARSTYRRYGNAVHPNQCRNGLGGTWRNDIYFIVPPFHHVGCFNDKPRRAIPHSGKNFHFGNFKERILHCAALANARGYDTFGVQAGGQCFTGPNARQTYRKYGNGGGCRHGVGGGWRNSVYMIG